MELVKNLRDHFLQGLRKTLESFRNQPGLTLLKNARSTENGIRPLPTISTEANIEAYGAAWPFPHIARFMDRSFAFDDEAAHPDAIDEIADPWTLTNVPLEDRYGNPETLFQDVQWQVANFGAFSIMVGDGNVVYNKSGDSTKLIKIASRINTVINYKNSQLVMGGIGQPVGIPGSPWLARSINAFLTRRKALDSDFPLPSDTPYQDGFPADMMNYIWWSSVSGGDALFWWEPWELMLPGYTDVILPKELLINGDFDTDTTGWGVGTGWARTGNKMVATAATGFLTTLFGTAYVEDPEYDHYYLLSFTWVASTGTCHIRVGKLVGLDWHSESLPEGVGPVTITIPIYAIGEASESNPPQIYFIPTLSGFSGSVDDVSLKEIVKHKQDYNANLPNLLALGFMDDADKVLIEAAWEGADGVSSWSAVPKESIVTNGNMYAGPDADSHSARYHKMWNKRNWTIVLASGSDYLTQGFRHFGEVIPISQVASFNYVAFDDDLFYDVLIHVVSRTVGSIAIVFGAGSGFEGRKNTSASITENGLTTIPNMQTDKNPGLFADHIRLVPSIDFDGTVVLLHVEDEDFAGHRSYAMESHTNHTNLKQLSATMNAPLIPGNRYRVKWDQMSYTPGDISREGIPWSGWGQDDYTVRPFIASKYWNVEDGTSSWWATAHRNILSNSLFYKSQVTGWVQGGNWSYDSGNDEMDHTVPADDDRLTLPESRMFATVVHGRTYDIVIEIRNRTAGQVWVRWGTNGVGDNEWLVPPGNGFFKSTITANNTATDWTRFVIATSDLFDGSVGEVVALDRTRSADSEIGAFEVYENANPLQMEEVFLNSYPLIEGKSYEVKWEIVDILDSHSVRVNVGGGAAGDTESSVGIYTDVIVCGNQTQITIGSQGPDGSLRLKLHHIKPLFDDGARPILATESEDVLGLSTYLTNAAYGVYQSFQRDILVPSSPANLDLEFEFEHRSFPIRITNVEIEPLDSETAIVDMQPKPKIFDYWERNEAGFLPIPFPGSVVKILQLEDNIVVYGTNSVCYVTTHTDPIHTKVAHSLPNYPRTLGVAHVSQEISGNTVYHSAAAFGDHTEHLFIDEKGELWHVASGAVPVLTKLGYQEFFAPMLGNQIIITRDQDTEAWFISDNNTGYYFRDGRLSETPYSVTFLEFSEGGLVGHKKTFDVFAGDPELTVLTNSIGGDGSGFQEIVKVQIIGRGAAGAYALGPEEITSNRTFDTDLSDWNSVGGWAWQTGGFARCNATSTFDFLAYEFAIFPTVIGRDYWTRMVIGGTPGGGAVMPSIGSINGTLRSTAGTFAETLFDVGVGGFAFGLSNPTLPVTNLDVDEISVRESRSATGTIPGLPFVIYVDAKLHDTADWTRFGPFWPDARGVASTKVLGVEFRIMVQSGNADLVELDDIRYVISDEGKRNIGKWKTAVQA